MMGINAASDIMTSREDCWYGFECRTQWHNSCKFIASIDTIAGDPFYSQVYTHVMSGKAHAMRRNHVCGKSSIT